MTDMPVYQAKDQAYWAQFFGPSPLVLLTQIQSRQLPTSGGNLAAHLNSLPPRPNVGLDLWKQQVKGASKDRQSNEKIWSAISGLDPKKMSGINLNELNPEQRKLAEAVMKMPGKPGLAMSAFTRALDILSRGNYASANITYEHSKAIEGETNPLKKALYFTPILIAMSAVMDPDYWKAGWQGLSGKSKLTYADLLEHANPDMNSVAKGTLGFLLDVGADPTTYIGFGAAKGAIKSLGGKAGIEAAEQAAKSRAVGEQIAKAIDAGGLDQQVKQNLERLWKESEYDLKHLELDKIDLTDPVQVGNYFEGITQFRSSASKPSAVIDKASRGRIVITPKGGSIKAAKNSYSGTVRGVRQQEMRMRRNVSVFLQATKTIVDIHTFKATKTELIEEATKAGRLVDLETLKPKFRLASPKRRTRTQVADTVGRIEALKRERSLLNEQLKYVRGDAPGSEIALLREYRVKGTIARSEAKIKARVDAINQELYQLEDYVDLNIADDELLSVIEKAKTDPDVSAALAQIDSIRQITFDELGKKGLHRNFKGNPAAVGVNSIISPADMDDAIQQALGTEFGHYAGQPMGLNEVADLRELNPFTPLSKKHPKYLQTIARRDNVYSSKTQKLHWDKGTDPRKAILEQYFSAREAAFENLARALSKYIYKNAINDVNAARGVRKARYTKKDSRELIRQLWLGARQVHTLQRSSVYKDTFSVKDVAKNSKKVDALIRDVVDELEFRLAEGSVTKDDLLKTLSEEKEADLPWVRQYIDELEPRIREDGTELERGFSLAEHGAILEIDPKTVVDPKTMADVVKTNREVLSEINAQAGKIAEKRSRDMYATVLESLVRGYSPLERKKIALKIGWFGDGAALATLAIPEHLAEVMASVAKYNPMRSVVGAFNKAFVASHGLDDTIKTIHASENITRESISMHAARMQAGPLNAVKFAQRNEVWQQIYKGIPPDATVNPELAQTILDELSLIGEKFAAPPVGIREKLSLSEVNTWMPHSWDFISNSTRKFRRTTSLGGGTDTLADGDDPVGWLLGNSRTLDPKKLDPAELIWNLHVATEKAIGYRATGEALVQEFGIAATKTAVGYSDPITDALVKEFNYRPVVQLGDDYIFAPEIANQIDKLMELMEPTGLRLMEEYQKGILQLWKRAVTVYNPGFHMRNTAGDVFVSWLDGVKGYHGVQSHKMALKVVKAYHNFSDEMLNAALKQTTGVYQAYENLGKSGMIRAPKTTEVLFKRKGKDFTIGDVWALYIHEGLRSTWTNTQFLQNFRPSVAGQKASTANRAVMGVSETREDWFRLAHFIDLLRRSSDPNLMRASADAASRVRKYHFDYNDFTQFEKMYMARVFPFYKWTRKAFPLMIQSLFMSPGKILVPAKLQTGIGYAAGYQGTQGDSVIPEWIEERELAPVGSKSGSTVYLGMANPALDIMRMATNPVDAATGMLNPFIKAPIELAQGRRLNSDAPVDLNAKFLTGFAPQSSQANQQITDPNLLKMLGFLSGVTVGINDDKATTGELIRRRKKAME